MPNLNKDDIGRFEISWTHDYKKIVAILSAYDELIENNARRIALLEKMAEEIYREWFVRLRFPGYENVPKHHGLPEEWDLLPVGEAFEITGGGTPSKEEGRYWDGGEINWYTPSDITAAAGMYLTESEAKCTEEGLSHSSARLFPPYCVMMTSRATIGALGINTTPACTNQGFITCIPNTSFPLSYLYFWLKLNKGYFEILSTGSTFLELIKSNFRRIKIIKSTTTIVESYDCAVMPMFKMIETLLQDNKNLKQTRDLLLSRLLSGKLDVENLDIRFPPGISERE
jgi:type I restriction enzyme, S subunit